MIMTVTTRITRRYLENKTKSDLAQMYLDLLDDDIKLENAAKEVVEHEREYRAINHLGNKAPDCYEALAKLIQTEEQMDSGYCGKCGDSRPECKCVAFNG